MSPRQLLPGLALRLCTPVTSMPTKTDMPARHARLGISLVFVANRFEGSIPAVRYIYIHHLYHLYRSTRWVGNRHTLNWVERQTDRHGSLASDLAIGVHPPPLKTKKLKVFDAHAGPAGTRGGKALYGQPGHACQNLGQGETGPNRIYFHPDCTAGTWTCSSYYLGISAFTIPGYLTRCRGPAWAYVAQAAFAWARPSPVHPCH